ncbi:epimerase [bacterium]|nr:epimerase [bacterium]|tara:strand:- start:14329 stop:15354 length:1026 start_codon:yes stop_codon:yes gene_type:complete
MRITITGGGGFLGWHLAEKFSDCEVNLFDFDSSLFSAVSGNQSCFVGDIRNVRDLEFAIVDSDIVIHAAAALPLAPKKDIFETNVLGTRNVLEVSRKMNVKKVVYVSSTAVYGVPDHHPLVESDQMKGVGSYGESKVLAELECMKAREKGMIIPVVRPKTFIGPERLGVFEILFDWVYSGTKIPVIGDGKNKYQLLDVADLVSAIELLINSDDESCNGCFNVGASDFSSVCDDLGELFKFSKKGSRIFPTNAAFAKSALAILELLNLSPLYKWVYGTADQDSWVDTAKLQKLGWSPSYSNSDTLIRTYKWYLENRNSFSNAGTGHRVPWKQGALALIKKFL